MKEPIKVDKLQKPKASTVSFRAHLIINIVIQRLKLTGSTFFPINDFAIRTKKKISYKICKKFKKLIIIIQGFTHIKTAQDGMLKVRIYLFQSRGATS